MTPVGLYLHFPYCRSRCTYCDFNAYAEPEQGRPHQDYLEALVEDIRRTGREHPYRVRTLFCGGGTPSLTPAAGLERVLKACRRAFHLDPKAEVTLEANPGTVTPDSLRAFRSAGFNRLSLGVQSFHDRLLTAIGRVHSGQEARQALEWARQAGFDNVNLDLIYGLPEQTLADWDRDLAELARLRPEHLSAYALTIEPGTRLEAQIRLGERSAPDEDLQADMAARLRPLLGAHGYRRYEVSNWALPGRECRHNMVYWTGRPYLGLGCGASSYVHGWRTRRLLHPSTYAQALSRGRSPVFELERLGREGSLKDRVILALRTRRGLDLDRVCGSDARLRERLEGFFAHSPPGLIARRGSRVRLTHRGQNVANVLFVELLGTALTLEVDERPQRTDRELAVGG